MISIPTVLVLGAGSSVEYGFPLGSTLVAQITTGVANQELTRHLTLANHVPEAIEEFARKLTESESPSIDAFIEGNTPQLVEIGRAAIAISILRAEKKCLDERRLTSKPPQDHWYRYIWERLREGTSAATFGDNKLSIITYNYDRSLEEYLVARLPPTFNLERSQAQDLLARALPIVHVHGVLDGPPFGGYPAHADGAFTRSLASRVRVVHDKFAERDEQYVRAHHLLAGARTVAFLGFGFHQANVDRLALAKHVSEAQAYVCAYGMGLAEVDVAESRLGVAVKRSSHVYKCWEFLRNVVPLK